MGVRTRFKRWSKLGSSSTIDVTGVSTNGTNALADALPPGDRPVHIEGEAISALEIRELSELIRKRYALDIKIWSNRKCHTNNRPLVEVDMHRADAALLRIRAQVALWDDPELWKSPTDLVRLQEIKRRLNLEGARLWMANPPWEDPV